MKRDELIQEMRQGCGDTDHNFPVQDLSSTHIKRFLDNLGRLSAQHGLWLEHDGRCIRLSASDNYAGYYSSQSGRRLSVGSYVGNEDLSDAIVVGDDHSQEGKRRGLEDWKLENADAIAQRIEREKLK